MNRRGYQKKIAVINDLTGFGRCALTVSIPILSSFGVQCCPLPTSILSNHTGYKSYFFDDYTENLEQYIAEWKKLNLYFDGILTGFLGSEQQIQIVKAFIRHFADDDTIVIVDPIMGDDGEAYATYTPAMCRAMKDLTGSGRILTPNLTEACILTDTTFRTDFGKEELIHIARTLKTDDTDIIITGIEGDEGLINLILEGSQEPFFFQAPKAGANRPGTGDIFSAILAGEKLRGSSLREAANKAQIFISSAIKKSDELEIPKEDGVCFEYFLPLLQ